MKVFLQNRLVDERRALVSVYDHGFLYGDGIYETVHGYNYRLFHWPEHHRRLRASARRIGLACPWSSRFLERAALRVLKANRSPNGSVRMTITRGPGPLGLDPRACPKPTLVMLLHPPRRLEKAWQDGVTVLIPEIRRNHPRALDPQIKSNNSLNTILARIETDRRGAFEGVLLNLDGFLTEGTTSNIFFTRGRTLCTPSLGCGLLAGVTRASVLRLARQQSLAVREGRFRPEDLLKADEAFLSSTTLEIAGIVRVLWRGKNRLIGPGYVGPVTRRLHEALRVAIAREIFRS